VCLASVTRRILLFALLASIATGSLAAPALGDADPASDILYSSPVFYSFDQLPSDGSQKRLNSVVASATKAGYPIRVALIAKPSDLGGISALWSKPRQYARFLALELSFGYKGSLLVVMPSGLGYSRKGKGSDAADAALRPLQVEGGADGMADTAVRAVARLSSAAGHPIDVPAKAESGGGSSRDLLLFIPVAALLLAGLLAAAYLLRRRGTRVDSA
jgi:hypothetical protein